MTKKEQTKIQPMTGIVVKSKDHTAIVSIQRLVKHPKYGKFIQYRTKYKAEDPADQREPGEKVTIIPCPPHSKEKRFRILRSETK